MTLQNSILWADIAHPINIGGHGNPDDKAGEILENITVRNVDILNMMKRIFFIRAVWQWIAVIKTWYAKYYLRISV